MLNSEQATQTTVFSVKHSVITLKALLLISPEKTWQIETCFTITHIGFSFCFCHFCDITLILDVVTLTRANTILSCEPEVSCCVRSQRKVAVLVLRKENRCSNWLFLT